MTNEPTAAGRPAPAHEVEDIVHEQRRVRDPSTGAAGRQFHPAEKGVEQLADRDDAGFAPPDAAGCPQRIAGRTTVTESRYANDDVRCGDRWQQLTAAGEKHSNSRGVFHRLAGRREIAFALVGVVNTAMGIALTVAWLALLGDAVPPSVGVVAAYLTGIGVAFVLHRRLVFRVRGRVLRDFLGFAAVNCGGLVANALLLEIAVGLFEFPRALSAVVVMGAVAAGTFFGHQYISFRRPAV